MGRSRVGAALDAAYDSGGLFAFRNRIINGDMRIDQRNAGASFTNSVGTIYTIDRWMSTGVGSSVTTQQVTGSTGNNKALRLTGASGNADAQLSQKIESWNILDLAGQSVTVSFTLSGSSSGTVYLRRLYPTATDNYTSLTEPDSSIAINFTTTPTQYTATFTLGANANKGLWLIFDFGAVGAAATRTLENVQLEKGSTATSFDYRPYGVEEVLCKRYTWVATSDAIITTIGSGVSQAWCQFLFPITMRATPSVSFSGQIGVSDQVSADIVCASPAVVTNQLTSVGGRLNVSGFASALASYRTYNGTTYAGSGSPGKIILSAEL